ncbi:MAG: universal stress protein [Candidatus Omnitrophica bacterium]|jgi:nucleotide-binding universal stress UspA family protein|nr:universal stress protein [Candidatus Omnitrophota bacterium]MDD5079529.1 universal stress protein [Candidatus Omnitrophota bacterium]
MAITNIVVSVAGGPGSVMTAKYAIALAKVLNAGLTAIYVVDEKVLHELLKSRIFVEVEARVYERDLEQQGNVFLERVKKMSETKSVKCEGILLKGMISDEVTNKAKELNADILVMGDIKEPASRTDVYYDEGERILRKAGCSVIVVKDPSAVESFYKEI